MTEPVRVLVVVTTTAGGAGEQVYQLARELDRDAFELTVTYGPGYPLDAPLEALDVETRAIAMSRKLAPFTNLRGAWQLWRLIRARRYHLVVTSCSIAGFFGRVAAKLSRVPLETVHILQVYASRPFQPPIKLGFYRWLERRLDRLTTRYVAVTSAVGRYGVESGIMSDDKLEVIFNAAELELPPADEVAAIRAELGIPADAPVVGTLGRFEEQKGLRYFLEAAARVREVHPAARFVLVGEGPLRAELERQADELGISEAIHITGWRRDVPALLCAMDLFCLASLWESFGIVLAEAMLAERPVVATAVDGIPEVVADGETGLLVPPRAPEPLAAAMTRILDDRELAREFGRAGRRRALAEFSVGTMVRGYEAMFRRLASPEK